MTCSLLEKRKLNIYVGTIWKSESVSGWHPWVCLLSSTLSLPRLYYILIFHFDTLSLSLSHLYLLFLPPFALTFSPPSLTLSAVSMPATRLHIPSILSAPALWTPFFLLSCLSLSLPSPSLLAETLDFTEEPGSWCLPCSLLSQTIHVTASSEAQGLTWQMQRTENSQENYISLKILSRFGSDVWFFFFFFCQTSFVELAA